MDASAHTLSAGPGTQGTGPTMRRIERTMGATQPDPKRVYCSITPACPAPMRPTYDAWAMTPGPRSSSIAPGTPITRRKLPACNGNVTRIAGPGKRGQTWQAGPDLASGDWGLAPGRAKVLQGTERAAAPSRWPALKGPPQWSGWPKRHRCKNASARAADDW